MRSVDWVDPAFQVIWCWDSGGGACDRVKGSADAKGEVVAWEGVGGFIAMPAFKSWMRDVDDFKAGLAVLAATAVAAAAAGESTVGL